ncbi:testis-specific serine/threonine-protein kinase 4-like [Tubulanus polymorphus]|uniref:testis-specific serine/threonine-protein kinase 4-like n=1 Tax=Tubulanus polymorphus TaxID=672921 RepID=UPI003DA4021E
MSGNPTDESKVTNKKPSREEIVPNEAPQGEAEADLGSTSKGDTKAQADADKIETSNKVDKPLENKRGVSAKREKDKINEGVKKELEKPAKPLTVLETHGYTVGHTLGHGSYATVKSAFSSKHKAQVAIKVISKKKAPTDFLEKFLPREIEVVKILRNPNVVCFLQSIETTSRVYLIMELCTHGDLLDMIRKQGFIKEPQAAQWFHQLAGGIKYCHSKGVVHRDLKCENLLLDGRLNLKVTDFGFARSSMVSKPGGQKILSETYCGSYAYAPPEILKGSPYEAVLADIWSMGVILFTMVFGRLPFDDSDHRTLLKQVQSPVDYPANSQVPVDCRLLISKILTGRRQRARMVDIEKDPWFRRVAPQIPEKSKTPTPASESTPNTEK